MMESYRTLKPQTSAATVSNAPQPASKRHVVVLPLLRGCAALSVALYHFTGAALPKIHIAELHELFKNGWVGVQVFFVISGFIIPYSLIGKQYSARQFLPYITKRIIRINPPAYIALILVLVQWYFIDYVIAHKINYTKNVSFIQIVHNMLFTVPFSEYKWIIGIFWTLSIEFQFYILIGLLFPLIFERNTIVWLVGAFCLLSLGQYMFTHDTYTFFHYSSLFGMGGLTVYRYQGKVSNVVYWTALLLFGILAYIQCGPYDAAVGLFTTVAIEYLTVDNYLTRFIGNISYSFYLIHVLVGNTCEFLLVRFISTGPVINRLGMQLSCLVAAIICAYIFYVLIERPFMKLSSRIK